MGKAYIVVTALCVLGVWRAMRMVALVIPFAQPAVIIDRLKAEISRLGFPPPTTHKNQLTFYSARQKSAVVVTVSASSATVTGPPSIREALRQVFPEAVEGMAGHLRRRALTFVIGGWIAVMIILYVLQVAIAHS